MISSIISIDTVMGGRYVATPRTAQTIWQVWADPRLPSSRWPGGFP